MYNYGYEKKKYLEEKEKEENLLRLLGFLNGRFSTFEN